jgi:membrane protein YdbS with pleckstrin-like domain
MRARVRDAIAVAVLLVAAIAVRFAWHPLGPWVSLAIAFVAGLVAVVVYRVRPYAPPMRTPSAEEAPQQPVLLRQG